MKKLKFTFLFYFSLIILSVVIQSCYKCDYKITDLLNLYAEGSSENVVIDSTSTIIRGEFSLVSKAQTEIASYFSDPGIIQTSYAFGCGGFTIVNPIDKSSIRISCDKNFKYDNSDILIDSSFHQFVDLEVYDFDIGGFSVYFDSTFISKAEFEKDIYTFKIQSRTIDCLSFTDELTLEMDL